MSLSDNLYDHEMALTPGGLQVGNSGSVMGGSQRPFPRHADGQVCDVSNCHPVDTPIACVWSGCSRCANFVSTFRWNKLGFDCGNIPEDRKGWNLI